MFALTIEKSDLPAILSSCFSDYQLFLPKEVEENKICLAEIKKGSSIECNGYPRLSESIKSFLLPSGQPLFYFERKSALLRPTYPQGKAIIFGVRPCDTESLRLLDKNFLEGGYIDPYYKKRREETLFFSVACNQYEPYCFCDQLGGSPYSLNLADAIFYDLGDSWNILTGKEEIAQAFGNFSKEKIIVHSEEDAIRGKAAEKREQTLRLSSATALGNLVFNDDLWSKIASTCIGCATCSYLCPTCYCFDLSDEIFGPVGKRVRTYDSCMFALYTLEASGHNPRPTLPPRWRQRFLHKFSYIPQQYGFLGCTGCGRCSESCPAGIDLREVIRNVVECAG